MAGIGAAASGRPWFEVGESTYAAVQLLRGFSSAQMLPAVVVNLCASYVVECLRLPSVCACHRSAPAIGLHP
jgi:hypothetical protein